MYARIDAVTEKAVLLTSSMEGTTGPKWYPVIQKCRRPSMFIAGAYAHNDISFLIMPLPCGVK